MKYIVLIVLAILLFGCEGGGLVAPPGWESGTDPSLPITREVDPSA